VRPVRGNALSEHEQKQNMAVTNEPQFAGVLACTHRAHADR
jgi:hypothetical protein